MFTQGRISMQTISWWVKILLLVESGCGECPVPLLQPSFQQILTLTPDLLGLTGGKWAGTCVHGMRWPFPGARDFLRAPTQDPWKLRRGFHASSAFGVFGILEKRALLTLPWEENGAGAVFGYTSLSYQKVECDKQLFKVITSGKNQTGVVFEFGSYADTHPIAAGGVETAVELINQPSPCGVAGHSTRDRWDAFHESDVKLVGVWLTTVERELVLPAASPPLPSAPAPAPAPEPAQPAQPRSSPPQPAPPAGTLLPPPPKPMPCRAKLY